MNDRIHNTISYAAAAGVGAGTYIYGGKVLALGVNKIGKLPHPVLSKQEVADLRDANYRMFINEGFNTDVVNIIDTSTPENKKQIEETIKNIEVKNAEKVKNIRCRFFRKLKEKNLARKLNDKKNKFNAYLNGKNACYSRNIPHDNNLKNLIIINLEKSPHFFAHELGHATNHRNLGCDASKLIYKTLRLTSKHNKTLFGLFLISMLTNKKDSQESKKDNIFKRSMQFIKNNGGKLSVLAGIPLLIEEGMANLHGQKFAKKYMDSKYMKLMTKTHINSFLSYSRSVAFAGLMLFIANKARDISYDFLKNLNQ